MSSPEVTFDHLNSMQREAVLHAEGNLLIVAGAGSGKTRVITEKIRHLVTDKNIRSWNILAITFTNKAAGEMKRRLEGIGIEGVWVSTFHSMGARVLRKEAAHLGLDENFSIYDTEDQSSVIRSILSELQLDRDEWDPRQILSSISSFKNKGISVEDLESGVDHYKDRIKARIYRQYQKALKINQALDFDDLLGVTLKLFQNHPAVLEKYQDRFKYVLVDEYQDTNPIQYQITRLISKKSEGVTVTGDPDQSIYSWRGADINNILNFEREFEEPKVIKLEFNYRSTPKILELANQVIRHNTERYKKDLLTEQEGGEKPLLFRVLDGQQEAEHISHSIAKLRANGSRLSDMAIFYRTNAQSRNIEEQLAQRNIPYEIVGGVSFFERMEVKDLVAYLRFIHNPNDSISLMRIVNKPARGISEKTKAAIKAYAEDQGKSCWHAMISESFLSECPSRAREAIKSFNKLAADLFAEVYGSPDILVERAIEDTGLMRFYEQKSAEEEERVENIRQFMSMVKEYCERNPHSQLSNLLEYIALSTDKKQDEAREEDRVTLMTLHAAKGLEFPIVFFAGLDEGILPHQRSLDLATTTAIEEERRLCYVGLTRAQQLLYLYTAAERFQYNRVRNYKESRFISEMLGEYLGEEGVLSSIFKKSAKKSSKSSFRKTVRPRQGQRFRRGEAVQHKQHGKGVVLDVEGEGSSEKVKVFFNKDGQKTLLVEFEPLERMG